MEIHKGEVFVVAVFLEKLRQNNFIFGEKQIKEVKLNKTYLELKTEEESLNLDFEELAEEIILVTKCDEFWQISSCLSHHPNRWSFYSFAS